MGDGNIFKVGRDFISAPLPTGDTLYLDRYKLGTEAGQASAFEIVAGSPLGVEALPDLEAAIGEAQQTWRRVPAKMVSHQESEAEETVTFGKFSTKPGSRWIIARTRGGDIRFDKQELLHPDPDVGATVYERMVTTPGLGLEDMSDFDKCVQAARGEKR